ncbi:Chloromuconate cycloisomerase [Flavobacterium sp. 9AF]|uniref:enolase C-terminal domain-like protein n=1 Tax=Flavobacterium sp. 9AF TaxID=2653142 RepID=UPI0012F2E2EA|nr:enolase C-terminal domain-like protein [Flavobacterium sp. 9AF]VXB54668.1 Chloromuconate cycloisomerase [Flavobacterium sp. 9AF]
MKLDWQVIRFQLKETFTISYGAYSYREALIVSLNKNGVIGYGECTAIDYYGIKIDDLVKELRQIQCKIETYKMEHPVTFYELLKKNNLSSFLTSALDCAYWDLFGKLENKNFLNLNSISYSTLPESSFTISIAPIEKQIEKINVLNWQKFKVKCNKCNLDSIRTLLNTKKEIALDANGSFSIEDCKLLEDTSLAERLHYIEQPMPVGYSNYVQLNASKKVNWMADEDCQGKESLFNLKSHYKTINIKLVKVGGLTPALELIKEAKANNFKIMIGCMTESTVGISAGAVLSPFADYVDLDGANLIANDLAIGTTIQNGKILLSEKPGLGIYLK